MKRGRISVHPILDIDDKERITFFWNNDLYWGEKGEMIASALIANGIHIFNHHYRDGSSQGIFCANGQCAKCLIVANGIPVKSCMTPLEDKMVIESLEGLPKLPENRNPIGIHNIEEISTDVLIIGGGPAGLSASLEIAKYGIKSIIVDDKHKLGGKLVLQTHKFFGSVEDSQAGTRGIEIGEQLSREVCENPNIKVWIASTILYIFKDRKVGVLKDGIYKLVQPKIILNTAGAREKFLQFHGNTLVGIYGAGAFQTLVNRDLVRPSERLFIIGGGNVGLIAGYHALQAGITVVGLAEAMPYCGGYKVHADKLKRLGVPIYTSHSILSANGEDRVTSITITEVDDQFHPIEGTEKTFLCDTILIAVGLESINEFEEEAKIAGFEVFSAGDANEIAEASSAMFNGKIAGLRVAKAFGADTGDIPAAWYEKADLLKAPPGAIVDYKMPDEEMGVLPIIHCIQEIPCNPCSTVCPTNSIKLIGDPIMGIPEYSGKCTGCGMCVAICPGLAITLVDYREDTENPFVTIPYEIDNYQVKPGDTVNAVDINGTDLGEFRIVTVKKLKKNKTALIRLKSPRVIAKKIVSFRIQSIDSIEPINNPIIPVIPIDASMVCLCERVTVGEVRQLIRRGVRDINQIKAITRAGMGPCGSKNCDNLIRQIFRQEGIATNEVIKGTKRPLFIEVALEKFADGISGGSKNE